jgi:hypothetical protein
MISTHNLLPQYLLNLPSTLKPSFSNFANCLLFRVVECSLTLLSCPITLSVSLHSPSVTLSRSLSRLASVFRDPVIPFHHVAPIVQRRGAMTMDGGRINLGCPHLYIFVGES